MSAALIDLVGYPAATLTTVAFLPQAWKSWQTRDLSGISLPMYALFTLGVFFWLLYGLLLHSWPIVLANALTLAQAASILGLMLVERRKKRARVFLD